MDQSSVSGLDECAPRFDVEVLTGIGPMDQIDVNDVQTHSHNALFDGGERFVKSVMASRQFRSHYQLVSRNFRASHGGPDGALVLVVDGGVEQSIADANRRGDGIRPVIAVE